MLDTFFRLLHEKLELKLMKAVFKNNILDLLHERIIHRNQTIYVCTVSFMKILLKFKSNLIQALEDDKRWKNILTIACKKTVSESSKDHLIIAQIKEDHFKVWKKLLYHVNKDSKHYIQLVISKTMKHIVFLLTHSSHHADFH